MKILLFTVLFTCVPQVLSLQCDFNPGQYISKGQAVAGEFIWKAKTEDAVECARSCIRRSNCKSFNFNTTNGMCQLYSMVGGPSTTETLDKLYSDIASWPTQIDPNCYKRPCADNEICIPRDGDGVSCSYSCFKNGRTCPVPPGSVVFDHPRTVGSIFTHTCGPMYVGGDSALCLASGEWNKTIDTSCTPLYGSTCVDDADCSPINGTCDINDNTCVCPTGNYYKAAIAMCHPECESGWIRYMDKCYILGTDEMTYSDAWSLCVSYGSQIVYVDSFDENRFLKEEMAKAGAEAYWNSLYQYTVDRKEQWMMTEGQQLEPTVLDWWSGEPSSAGEWCTIAFQPFGHLWIDTVCHSHRTPLCKRST